MTSVTEYFISVDDRRGLKSIVPFYGYMFERSRPSEMTTQGEISLKMASRWEHGSMGGNAPASLNYYTRREQERKP